MKGLVRSLVLISVGVAIGFVGQPMLPSGAQGWVVDRQEEISSVKSVLGGISEPIRTVDHLGRTLTRASFCGPSDEWKVTQAPTGNDLWACVSNDGKISRYSADDAKAFEGRLYAATRLNCTGSGTSGGQRYVYCRQDAPPTATPTPNPAGPRPDWCPAYATWGYSNVRGFGSAPTCSTGTHDIYMGNWRDIAEGCGVSHTGMGTTTRCPRP